jgi:peroxiredoxin
MAKTPSTMVALETPAPTFSLPDTVSGEPVELANVCGKKATVVMFICNHCPFVKHVNAELVALAKDYLGQEVGFVAISSNDVANYPDDSPEKMRENAKRLGFSFPYLYDETQEVAKSYQAACTPDFFVYDKDLSLRYRGQLDDSRPGNDVPVTGRDLRLALDALVSGTLPASEQKPAIGCNIKWKN